jgi:hypothetical protein
MIFVSSARYLSFFKISHRHTALASILASLPSSSATYWIFWKDYRPGNASGAKVAGGKHIFEEGTIR